MRILADENIPFAKQVFSLCGETKTVHGRNISSFLLNGFDALIVRSITPVNEQLLAGSSIKFVGTATTGTDHIDHDWLKKENIPFADAAGSNSISVAEFIMALIIRHAVESGFSLHKKSIGIVGVGRIGTIVSRMANSLGMKVLKNDPPLEKAGTEGDWKTLEDLFDCDFLTFHTPLTKTGSDPTFHLINEKNLSSINPKTFLINSARGPVIDNVALLKSMQKKQPEKVALDVWENEPHINFGLLKHTYHATPHIAGYSYDGKINGTIMMYNALCRVFQIPVSTEPEKWKPKIEDNLITLENKGKKDEEVLLTAITSAYDFEADHQKMMVISQLKTDEERGTLFDKLRKEYPQRREFSNYKVRLTSPDASLTAKLKGLGFMTEN